MNMTQYRVNARNCEAKRLHIRALCLVCRSQCRHQQIRACLPCQTAGLDRRRGGHAAPCPHKLGSGAPDMANCSTSRYRCGSAWLVGAMVSFGQWSIPTRFFSH